MFPPKLSYLFNRRIVRFLMLPASLFLICPNCLAAYNDHENITVKASQGENPLNNMQHTIGENFQLTGIRLAPDLYLGKTMLADNSEFSLVFDMGNYAYEISDDKFNFSLRF